MVALRRLATCLLSALAILRAARGPEISVAGAGDCCIAGAVYFMWPPNRSPNQSFASAVAGDPANPSVPVARASLTHTELTLYSTRICALRVSIVPAVARVLAVARTLCVVFDGGRAMFWTAIHDSKTDDVIRARGPTCRRGAATCCLVREFASQRAARGLASGIVMANSTAVPWSEVSVALIAPRSPADGRWQAADDGRKNRKWRTHEATRQHRSGGARLRP